MIALGVAILLADSLPRATPEPTQPPIVVTGRVTSSLGAALPGATVTADRTIIGVTTNEAGDYRIVLTVRSAATEVTLVARALGYRPRRATIDLAVTARQDFVLEADPLRLDELVVTGVSAATSTKRLSVAVGRVSGVQLNVAPAPTILGALQGRLAGVRLMTPNGKPGGMPRIQLRGATSITGSSDPLIVVDGTIVRASLADFGPEDVDRVEVLKGAAAASLYGSDAANGVIQIFTKRGAHLPDGRLQVVTRFEAGRSSLSRLPATTRSHPFLLMPNGSFFRRPDGSRVLPSQCVSEDDLPGGCPVNQADVQDKPYPTYFPLADFLYRPGTFTTQTASIGQRSGRSNFLASFQNLHDQGTIFNRAPGGLGRGRRSRVPGRSWPAPRKRGNQAGKALAPADQPHDDDAEVAAGRSSKDSRDLVFLSKGRLDDWVSLQPGGGREVRPKDLPPRRVGKPHSSRLPPSPQTS